VKENHHPALITRDLFAAVQARLSGNYRRKSGSRKHGQYPLSQMLVCAECGGWMYGVTDKQGPLYRCGTSVQRKGCGARSVREEDIVSHVAEALHRHFLSPEEVEKRRALVRAAEGRMTAGADGADGDRAGPLRKRVAALDAQIKTACGRMVLVPEEGLEDARKVIRDLEDRRDRAKAELELVVNPPALTEFNAYLARVDNLATALEAVLAEKDQRTRLGFIPPTMAPIALDDDGLRVYLRDCVERVELSFGHVRQGKRSRYPLLGGTIYLKGRSPEAFLAASQELNGSRTGTALS
jgi:hypothetical protein